MPVLMQQPSLIKHLRDIIILPFTVTVVIPWLNYNKKQGFIPGNIVTKISGLLFFIAGLSLFLYTVWLFRTFGKGTLAPWTPTQKLIIRGPYKYCRNPMITGVLSVLIGESLFLHSTNILTWACTFFVINNIYFVLLEEPGLDERFGDEYKRYKQNVPRWIPRFRPYPGNNLLK
jgi:protein-S-isoprenylcysteine O-methyltransferase Ste14